MDFGLDLGWSLKKLHRLLLTSNAYKQSSRASGETLGKDPENRWFSRMNRLRLEAEAVRDACLAVSGRLNRKTGGPGVFPPLPPEARPSAAAWPVTADRSEHTRRSLYLFVRRNLRYPFLETFDAPDTNLSCPRRETSTTAPQALALLNDMEMQANARALSLQVRKDAAGDEARIRLVYRLLLSREPGEWEVRLGEEFLARQAALLLRGTPDGPTPAEAAASAAWTDYCLALLNLNEFLYLD